MVSLCTAVGAPSVAPTMSNAGARTVRPSHSRVMATWYVAPAKSPFTTKCRLPEGDIFADCPAKATSRFDEGYGGASVLANTTNCSRDSEQSSRRDLRDSEQSSRRDLQLV